MMTGTNVQFGTVVGAIIAMPSLFGQLSLWWHIYLLELVILLVVLAALPFMPESPGYLMSCNNDSEARKSIKFFWNCPDDEIDSLLLEIKANMKQSAASMSLLDVWKNRTTRRGAIVGIVVCFAMAFTGIA
ncbi:unnamed protein product, partial [Gongylonema pulchrum]|uniref:MFS domain-containing protein n=1 Tax=Gongylonema pulchrum TaxID=637853 RepID=A0A183EQ62_9BILA